MDKVILVPDQMKANSAGLYLEPKMFTGSIPDIARDLLINGVNTDLYTHVVLMAFRSGEWKTETYTVSKFLASVSVVNSKK